MRGFITIPSSVSCASCIYCGARPIISMVEIGEYIVKCPNSDSHYQTEPGLIDMDDWNLHNTVLANRQVDVAPCPTTDHFFSLNGTIMTLENID